MTTSAPAFPSATAKIYAFRHVAAPLLSAVLEVRALAVDDASGTRQEGDAAAFSQLIETVSHLASEAAAHLGTTDVSENDGARLMMAAAASTVVASYYRATGKTALTPDSKAFVLAVKEALNQVGDVFPAQPVSSFGKTFLIAKSLIGMAPVVVAVNRYAFGRAEQSLMGDIAQRLQRSAQSLMQQSLGTNSAEEDRQTMYAVAIDVVGHIYAECHHIESERLVDMTPEERASYLARHNNQIPMDSVWSRFDQHISMATTLAAHFQGPQGIAEHFFEGIG